MLLLTEDSGEYRLLLVEAKTTSNNAWYAVIESLRQLRLFTESQSAQRIVHRRHKGLPSKPPVTAVVLGPGSFFEAKGARKNSVAPALALLASVRERFGIDARLATWDPNDRRIDEYARP